MRRWTAEARRAVAARGLDLPTLRNILPRYVTALADAGEEELGRFSGERRLLVAVHFASRIRQGYLLPEIVEEMALLGRCIAQSWQAQPPAEQPSNTEIEALFTELNLASVAMAEMFTRHMLDDEQVEKRFLRQIQTVVTEALEPQGAPLAERLEQVLLLIMEAMGAQCAALLIFNPSTRQLETAAAVGVAHEELERSVSARGLSLFAREIEANEDASALSEAVSTELDVPAELRQSGIHALLGMRLPARHTLLSVAYVGLAEGGAFSARDERRLESLGAQLTLHLDNAQLHARLRQRISELDDERKVREGFVSVLAHDLRGPLAAAKISAHLLMKHPERSDLAAKIGRNIDRSDRMIRDLLDANRLRAGQSLPLHITACDVGALMRELVDELNETFAGRFLLEAEEHVSGFWSADELRRALWNLATNALKYGAPTTPITLRVQHEGDGLVQLSVHNWGAPITPEDQAHLFVPFSRTRSAETGGQQGWGLGLTLVRGCAEAHGGSVDVTSASDTGTTFTIVLPRDSRPFQQSDAGVPQQASIV